jgi:hypothetical protein
MSIFVEWQKNQNGRAIPKFKFWPNREVKLYMQMCG